MKKKTIWIIVGAIVVLGLSSVIPGSIAYFVSNSISNSKKPKVSKICGLYQEGGLFAADGKNRILKLKTNGKFSLEIAKDLFAGAEPAYVSQLGLKTKSPDLNKSKGFIKGKWEFEGDTITLSGEKGFSLRGKISKKSMAGFCEYWSLIDESGKRWKGPEVN